MNYRVRTAAKMGFQAIDGRGLGGRYRAGKKHWQVEWVGFFHKNSLKNLEQYFLDFQSFSLKYFCLHEQIKFLFTFFSCIFCPDMIFLLMKFVYLFVYFSKLHNNWWWKLQFDPFCGFCLVTPTRKNRYFLWKNASYNSKMFFNRWSRLWNSFLDGFSWIFLD